MALSKNIFLQFLTRKYIVKQRFYILIRNVSYSLNTIIKNNY